MLFRAGIEPTSTWLHVGHNDHYTIEATTLATWPLNVVSSIIRRSLPQTILHILDELATICTFTC